MSYSTYTELKKAIPDNMMVTLSNDVAGAASVNMVNLLEAIDKADREIDAYLAVAGYAVPMSPVPPLIADLSAKMAIWNLHLRKYFKSEIWEQTYKDCKVLLLRIADGRLNIGQTTAGVQTSGNGGCAVYVNNQIFTDTVRRMF